MGEYGLAERVLAKAPSSALGGAIVAQVLVQRRIEGEAEQAVLNEPRH
jgi:hypothetical protein